MKLSVSLPDDDVAFVDEYALRVGDASRSAVVHRAISMLRMAELESAYAEAWADWAGSDDAELWNETVADGVADAPR
jgi:Arc/MetJ-type ribon-helix-helix transcriptional regulator